MNKIHSEDVTPYAAPATPTPDLINQEHIIAHALSILDSRIRQGDVLASPTDVRNYLKLTLSGRECEYFGIVFLDNRHRVIEFEEMFRGTVDGASVYPREVMKATLQHNAAAVILAHNHPSGVSEPSQADRRITARLKDALALVDVRILDHFIVGDGVPFSFAENGIL